MAKKQRRQVSSTVARSQSAPVYTPASASRRITPVSEFKPDYSHVISDLKRIGILAASFFGVLIVLSFVLH